MRGKSRIQVNLELLCKDGVPGGDKLSEKTLEAALIQFLTEKVGGRFSEAPREYMLHVSEQGYHEALTLLTFDLDRKSIVPPGVGIDVVIDRELKREEWYVSAKWYDFIVGNWHDKR
jgi:hypothetical protein